MTEPFKKHEIVILNSEDPDYEEINDLEVTIREIYKDEDEDGGPYYLIIAPDGILWGADHQDLKSTGKFAEPVDDRSDTTLRVSVSEDGVGTIKEIIIDDRKDS